MPGLGIAGRFEPLCQDSFFRLEFCQGAGPQGRLRALPGVFQLPVAFDQRSQLLEQVAQSGRQGCFVRRRMGVAKNQFVEARGGGFFDAERHHVSGRDLAYLFE